MKKPTLLDVAQKNPSRDRIISRGLQTREELSFTYSTTDDELEEVPAVDRFGGSRGSGVIRQASLIAAGEALGHDQWIDGDALDQVVELGNEKSSGLKVRFTHPSMSGDGLGSYLGRARSLVRDGDQVFGDVHFSPSSRDTPDGDLGGYVMELAEDDPEAFGMSIVFDHDPGAEAAFVEGHTSDEAGFLSPDERNLRSLPHVRLASLHAADFVDSPAANPTGLFHRGPTADILTQAENLFDFALGLTDDEPEDSGGFSASRLRGFLDRFCDGRGIALKVVSTRKATHMSAETQEDEILDQSVETETPESDPENEATVEETVVEEQVEEPVGSFSRSDVEKFATKFGADQGMKYLLGGTSFEDALSAEFDLLKVKGSIVGGEGRGEDGPVGTFGGEGDEKSFSGGVLPKSVERFSSLISLPASRN